MEKPSYLFSATYVRNWAFASSLLISLITHPLAAFTVNCTHVLLFFYLCLISHHYLLGYCSELPNMSH